MGQFNIIESNRIVFVYDHFCCSIIGFCNMSGDMLETSMYIILHGGIKSANGTYHLQFSRNNIMTNSSLYLTYCNYHWSFGEIFLSAYNLLNGIDDLSSCGDRVYTFPRLRTM